MLLVIVDQVGVNGAIELVLSFYVSQESAHYFVTFYLVDGTSVTRAYWLNSGELARGILLPKTFGTAAVQAVVK